MAFLLVFLVAIVLPAAATLLFKAQIANRIINDILRISTIGIFYVAALVGFSWGSLLLTFPAFDLGDMYPTTTHPINHTYYFTQQEYGFVTMMSSGYDLTFYQQQPYWFDQELGKVQLECAGKENIRATVRLVDDERIRLRIDADAQERVDTTLSVMPPFNFRRTFEDRTLAFPRRP